MGNLKLKLCLGIGNAAPASSGTGITFPASQSGSSDSNTLDDYREATATITATTGFATAPSGTASFTRVGAAVTMQLPYINGSSNTTTFVTDASVPTAFRPSVDRDALCYLMDNGASSVGIVRVGTTGTLTFFKDPGGTAFTASGIKRCNNVCISYIV